MTEREEIYLKGLEQGMQDQKNIVLKLIDEKIQELQNEINGVKRNENITQFFKTYENMFILKSLRKLEELKEELEKKN